MLEISGKITHKIYSNKSSGFFILKVNPDDGSKGICVKGSFPGVPVDAGIKAKFSGDWVDHPSYGRQFNAVFCNVVPEKGKTGIVSYLVASVKSIGPITASKLYDEFGDDLPEVLESEPDRIRGCSFLNRNQSDALLKEWSESSDNRTSSIFLADLGLNSSQIRSVYSKFGTNTRQIISNDPYRLYECDSVGFVTTDSAARKLGVGVDDQKRVDSIILFALRTLSESEGHMYCTSDQIKEFTRKMFFRHSIEPFSHGEYVSESAFYQAISNLVKSSQITSDDGRIYLDDNWDHESTSAECLALMVKQEPRYLGGLEEILKDFEKTYKVTLSDEQRLAFMMLDKSRICAVSGFPGTGKTLLVSAYVHLFEKANLNYVLMSPTGIAAKRLSQMTGKPASTIHRALSYQVDGTWNFNSSNKFIIDAVVVDEVSMLDGATFFHLISALDPSTIVIFVGDAAQLPSVGPGYVLGNLMRCDAIKHVSLTKIYRQEKQSDIISIAHSILKNKEIDTSFKKDSEFVFLPLNKEIVIQEICKLALALKAREANFQVLAPMYNGDLGINALNLALREVLNHDFISGKAAKLKHGEVDLYEGDRVMVVKNDYERAVFNGDTGKITRISTKDDEVEVRIFDWFDQESTINRYVDKVFVYKIEEARQKLKVAFACSVHRCQGNEYDYIVMPMTMKYGVMLYKNLIYTAITRAKKKVFVFGDSTAFSYAISNNKETVRNSHLNEMVSESVSVPD